MKITPTQQHGGATLLALGAYAIGRQYLSNLTAVAPGVITFATVEGIISRFSRGEVMSDELLNKLPDEEEWITALSEDMQRHLRVVPYLTRSRVTDASPVFQYQDGDTVRSLSGEKYTIGYWKTDTIYPTTLIPELEYDLRLKHGQNPQQIAQAYVALATDALGEDKDAVTFTMIDGGGIKITLTDHGAGTGFKKRVAPVLLDADTLKARGYEWVIERAENLANID